MIKLTVAEDGITGALTGLSAGMGDNSSLMVDLAQYLYLATHKNFEKESGPDGSVWVPRSPATLEIYKRQRSLWGRILQKEGGLFDSIATDSGHGFASVFVNRPYAAVQQFGAAKGSFGPYSGTSKSGRRYSGSSPWGNIPARPFLGIAEEQETAILDIVQEWLEGLAE
jgi:phage virion morphogenesis protein